MWAEARKHEKKIRGIVIDLRRRAERRRAHYDAIKEDPVSFTKQLSLNFCASSPKPVNIVLDSEIHPKFPPRFLVIISSF